MRASDRVCADQERTSEIERRTRHDDRSVADQRHHGDHDDHRPDDRAARVPLARPHRTLTTPGAVARASFPSRSSARRRRSLPRGPIATSIGHPDATYPRVWPAADRPSRSTGPSLRSRPPVLHAPVSTDPVTTSMSTTSISTTSISTDEPPIHPRDLIYHTEERKSTIMFQHPELLRQLADDRQAELRRAAGATRLRREARRSGRRARHRAGPARSPHE